ncbi:HPr kinase/phosphorylase [Pseudoruegeria sp. HB172150]|uniref:HPr kinase/phosphorylase n=1 Tax=Pseudoruegeria sp. HB172150 TaxID=2721164 RepID=UPI001552D65C|nr:HPr kinase/phosphatase C-terminal domain-containing protein [Pseudoruegeria sp. HB172150]
MLIHASTVAIEGRAVLIRGASGSGKSALALQLIALGAGLVADDQTELTLVEGWPVASCPPAIRGRIEARGVGILAVEAAAPARVALVVDMDVAEAERLPPERHTRILGCTIPLLHKVESVHFASAIFVYLKAGSATI